MISFYAIPPIFLLMTALAAALVGGLLAGPIFNLLLRLKSRQTVSQYVPEHAAKQGTPTMGGLIVGAGFLGGMAYTFLQLRDLPSTYGRRYYAAVILLFLLFAGIGFVDDFVVPRMMKGKRGLGWSQKLIFQMLASMMFVATLGRHMPDGHATIGIVLILFFSNAYNFADGLDALAGSLLLAILGGLCVVASVRFQSGLFPIIGALFGGALPFLYLNRPPAKVFMGDVGSLPIGAVLGVLVAALTLPGWSIGLSDSGATVGDFGTTIGLPLNGTTALALLLISVMMLVELVPVPLQILSVKLRKKRLFPATPIHHSFQRAGWTEMKIVTLFVGTQIALSLAAAGIVLASPRAKLPQGQSQVLDLSKSPRRSP